MANYEVYKENARIKRQQKREAELPKKKPDTDLKEQNKQCKNCKYHYKDGFYEFCDYVSWHGELRDRGEGPGKCGSFLPKETKAKRKKNAYIWR